MLQAQQQQAFARVLTTVAELKATDLHMTPGSPPIVRIDGKLKSLTDEELLTPDVIKGFVEGLLTEEQRTYLEQHKDITVSQSFQDRIRFRMNVYYQKGNLALSLRFIPEQIPAFDSLGLPERVTSFINLTHGLLLLVGPFGSGKTTTAASLIDAINQTHSKHIVTAEDPIEYIFLNSKSIIEQREVGRDAESVTAALDLADREDVDVIFISGMKSPEVIQKVVDLSTTNRLIIATMAADSIVHALQHITSAHPSDQRERIRAVLSETIQGVMGHHLLSRIGGGRVLVPELLIPNSAARTVIREGNYTQLINILQTSRDQGMFALDSMLAYYVGQGVITKEEAQEYASDPEQFSSMITKY